MSDRAGIVFTAEPGSGDQERIVVVAAAGELTAVAEGRSEPDTYVVQRDPLHIVSVRIGHPRAEDDDEERVLTAEQILTLARLGVGLQEAYATPQAVEWAMDGPHIHVRSTRDWHPAIPDARAPHHPDRALIERLVHG
jgi:pyruvate,water dikinase